MPRSSPTAAAAKARAAEPGVTRSRQKGAPDLCQSCNSGNLNGFSREKRHEPHQPRPPDGVYNATMNARLYEAARQMLAASLRADRKAFFGSILGTLNHLVNADIIWLKRCAAHPANFGQQGAICALPDPARLGAIGFNDIDSVQGFAVCRVSQLPNEAEVAEPALKARLHDLH
jgi:hypothetical protein